MGATPSLEYLLRASQNYNRTLIEACVAPIFVLSPDLRITDVNEETVRWTQSARERLIGTPLEEHFRLPPTGEVTLRWAFASGHRVKLRITETSRTPEPRTLAVHASTFVDPDGRRRAVVVGSPD
ncbi:MAG TPA: PAS domain-containing protein [Thermoplasmata archaeon]|nr:PAS domain-containing protein [Thermoplasmata archaeon]